MCLYHVLEESNTIKESLISKDKGYPINNFNEFFYIM